MLDYLHRLGEVLHRVLAEDPDLPPPRHAVVLEL